MRVESPDAEQPELVGDLVPPFSSEHLEYHLEASFWAEELQFKAIAATGAQLSLNDVPSGAEIGVKFPIEIGDNAVRVTVENGVEVTEYRVTIHRRRPVRLTSRNVGVRSFGEALAAAGDYLVVGAPATDEYKGTVHLFRRAAPGEWVEQSESELIGAGDLGASLAFDGQTLVSGARTQGDRNGAAYVHRLNAGRWDTTATFLGGAGAEIGSSVALSGAHAAVASDNFDEVHTYSRGSGGNWVEDAGSPLKAPEGSTFIEATLSIDGDWLVVGAHNGEAPTSHVYTWDGVAGTWLPSTGQPTLSAPGMFADSVALRQGTLVVNGEPARVFERSAGATWSSRPLPVDSLGAVAVNDDTLLVGSQQDAYNEVLVAGVHVFRRTSAGAWQDDPLSPLVDGSGASAGYGHSVAIAGSTVFVGAPKELVGGAVYVYE